MRAVALIACLCSCAAQPRTVALTFDDLPVVGMKTAQEARSINLAILNALAIRDMPGGTLPRVLAALIGGDLGPRLLPMGSLAGLLWLDLLRRQGIHIGLSRFIRVGLAVTLPTLALSLSLLLLSIQITK